MTFVYSKHALMRLRERTYHTPESFDRELATAILIEQKPNCQVVETLKGRRAVINGRDVITVLPLTLPTYV